MIDNKRIAKNTMFLYFRMFIIMGVSLYTSRVVLESLGIVDYGLYNVVGGVVTMFSFLSGSLGSATSRFITFELGKKDFVKLKKIFNVTLVVHICIAILLIILAETVGLWFFYNKMTIPTDRMNASFWVYQISVFTMLISLTQVPYNATIIAHENMKIYAYVGFVEVIVKLVIVYLLTISSIDKLIFYALLLCALQICIMIFYRFYCIKQYSESRISFCKEKSLYKDIFSYSGSDMIGNIAVMAQGQGLNLLLNVFFGPSVNAARGIAYQVQGAVTQFSNNFMTAVRPQIIKSYAEDKIDDMWKLVNQSSCFSYYLLWIICLPIILEADTILKIWLGNYPDYSVSFLRLILVLCLIQTIKTPRVTIFHAMGKIFVLNLIAGFVLCSAFPLAYLFLQLGYSPNSVFWASNISMVLSEIASVLVLKHFLDFSVFSYIKDVHLKCIIVTVVSFIIPYYFCYYYLDAGLIRLMITILLSCFSVCVTTIFLGMNKEMRRALSKLIFKKLHIQR